MAGAGRRGSTTDRPLLQFIKSNQFKHDLQLVYSDAKQIERVKNLWTWLEIARKKEPFPAEYNTHSLSGEWKGYNDTHVANDLVVIWKYVTGKTAGGAAPEYLVLMRIGSHPYLGLK